VIAKKLKELLDSKKIKYVTLTHSPAYTIQEIAEAAHIPSDKLAKTVIVKLDGTLGMAVVPGNKKINIEALKKLANVNNIDIATESEFRSTFPDCDLGAMPPFGNLYKMKIYMDDSLAKDKEIGFNAGNHSEIIKMKYEDYESLAGPIHGHFVI